MNIIYSDTHAESSMTKAVQMSSVQCTHLYIPSMYTQYFDMNSFTPPLSLSLSFFQTINHYYIISQCYNTSKYPSCRNITHSLEHAV